MKKYLIGVFLLLLLTACGPSETPQTNLEAESTTNEEAASETTNEDETESDVEAETETEETVATEEESEEEEDTAVTAIDGPTYEPASEIPAAAQLRATDHTKGAEEPIIAIIEYGDFQ